MWDDVLFRAKYKVAAILIEQTEFMILSFENLPKQNFFKSFCPNFQLNVQMESKIYSKI
jgi:hypothetical protein